MSETTQTGVDERAIHRQESPGVLMRLYSVLWWITFGVITIVVSSLAILMSALFFFDPKRKIAAMNASLWGWLIYAVNPFWTLNVQGRNKLPWNERGIIVANHDSLADILVVAALFRPFKFVSKESIFKVPFLGWGMTMVKHIPLRRGDGASVKEMLDKCRYWLGVEYPIMMFPEGTRSHDGKVKAFKDGAFQLAIETDSPIYPVVLAGTADALPKHGWIAPLESHVTVKVLDPVYPSEFQGNLEALREHVRTVIVAGKARETELLRKRRF